MSHSISPVSEKSYHAFLSYRHADNKEQDRQWASWLHHQLETYEVPAELVGTRNERGDVIPEQIYPVFRDEASLPADADLENTIANALDRSRYLIVLCSTRAVQSRYVAEEILRFKRKGKSDSIIAVILDGEPNASMDVGKQEDGCGAERECFPEPLRHPVTDAGELDRSRRVEPIAADFRLSSGEQGYTSVEVLRRHLAALPAARRKVVERHVSQYRNTMQRAFLKIVAGVLGVPLETLWRRDREYALEKARRRATLFWRVAVGMSLLAGVALASFVFAVAKRREAEVQRAIADKAKENAQHELGVSWLERGKSAFAAHRPFDAAVFAAKAVAFEGVVPEEASAAQREEAALLRADSPDAQAALRLSREALLKARPIWMADHPPGAKGPTRVDAIAFSPVEARVAFAHQDGIITVRDAVTGVCLGGYQVMKERIASLTYSPDGASLCVGVEDGRIVMLATDTMQPRYVLKLGLWPRSVAFSPDGAHLATGSAKGGAQIWRVADGKLIRHLPEGRGSIESVTFSPDGERLAVADSEHQVRIYHCYGKWPLAFGIPAFPDRISLMRFTPGARKLLVVVKNDVMLWDVGTQKLEQQSRVSGDVQDVTFVGESPGYLLVQREALHLFRRDKDARVVDSREAGRFSPWIELETDAVEVAMTGSGRFFAVGTREGRMSLWATREADQQARIEMPSKAGRFQFSNDGQQVLHTNKAGDGLDLIATNAPRVVKSDLRADGIPASFLAISPARRRLVSAHPIHGMRVRDLQSGEVVSVHDPDGFLVGVTIHAWSKSIITATEEKITFRSVRSGSISKIATTQLAASQKAACIASHPTEDVVAVGTSSGEILVLESYAAKPALVFKASETALKGIVYTDSGNSIVAASGGEIACCDARTGASQWRWQPPGGGDVLLGTDRVAEWVAAVSAGRLFLLDAATGAVVRDFPDVARDASCLTIGGNGTIVLGLKTGDIRVLHPNAAAPLIGTIPGMHAGAVKAVVFDWEGYECYSVGDDGVMVIGDTLLLRKKEGHPAVPRHSVRWAASPDLRWAAMESEFGVQLWDVVAGKVLHKGDDSDAATSVESARSMAFSSDGRILAVGWDNGRRSLWTVPEFTPIEIPAVNETDRKSIDAIAISGNGAYLIQGLYAGAVRVLSLAQKTEKVVVNPVSHESIRHLVVGGSGSTFVVERYNGKVECWDAATGIQLCTASVGPSLSGIALSQDASHVFTVESDAIRTFAVRDGGLVAVYPLTHFASGDWPGLQVVKDGTGLCYGAARGPALEIWSTQFPQFTALAAEIFEMRTDGARLRASEGDIRARLITTPHPAMPPAAADTPAEIQQLLATGYVEELLRRRSSSAPGPDPVASYRAIREAVSEMPAVNVIRHRLAKAALQRTPNLAPALVDFVGYHPLDAAERQAGVRAVLSQDGLLQSREYLALFIACLELEDPALAEQVSQRLTRDPALLLENGVRFPWLAAMEQPALSEKIVSMLDLKTMSHAEASTIGLVTAMNAYRMGKKDVAVRAISALVEKDPRYARRETYDALSYPAAYHKTLLDVVAQSPQMPGLAFQRPVRIGVIAPLDGPMKTYGEELCKGLSMALRSGNLARAVRLEISDNKSDAGESQRMVRQLSEAFRPDLVFGFVSSANAIAAIEVTEREKIPCISPVATSPSLSGSYFSRTSFSDSFHGTIMARFAQRELKARTAVIIAPITTQNAMYPTALAGAFRDEFALLGGAVQKELRYEIDETNFTNIITELRALSPDAVFAPGFYSDVARLLKACRGQGITVPFLGGDGWDSPDLIKVAGPAAVENCYFSTFFAPDDPDPRVQQFTKDYISAHRRIPGPIAFLAYDGMSVVMDSLRRTTSLRKEDIQEAIRSTRNFPGLLGSITIGRDGTAVRHGIVMEFRREGDNVQRGFKMRIAP